MIVMSLKSECVPKIKYTESFHFLKVMAREMMNKNPR